MLLLSRIWRGGFSKIVTKLRIINLIKDAQRDPFKGIGKPEALRHELRGCWSRRIDQEHRLIYQVTEENQNLSLPVSLLRKP